MIRRFILRWQLYRALSFRKQIRLMGYQRPEVRRLSRFRPASPDRAASRLAAPRFNRGERA
jgi:hypothetical protein